MENQVNLFTINDIWEESDKQIPLDCTKTYDPLHFWEDYGERYFNGFKNMNEIQRNVPWIIHKLTSLKVEKLLDVGCGFCRIEPFLTDSDAVKEITALDFSTKQIESAEPATHIKQCIYFQGSKFMNYPRYISLYLVHILKSVKISFPIIFPEVKRIVGLSAI